MGLSGNLCRCTGYVGIVEAVRSVIAARRGRGLAPIAADPKRGLGPVGARIGSGLAAAGASAPKTVAPRVPPPAVKVAAAFTPTHSFEQSFTVRCPPAEAFAAFGRIREIADCIPGAFVDGEPAPDRVEGGIRVRLGPIPRCSAGRPSSNGTMKNSKDESWGRARTPASAPPCKAKFAIAL